MSRQPLALAFDLRAAGHSWVHISTILRQRLRMPAMAAMRLAHGWSQTNAAEQWNRRWPDDLKTFKNFSSWETWPAKSGHRPSLLTLKRLAELYQCAVSDLLDQADFRHLDDCHPPTGTDDRPPALLNGLGPQAENTTRDARGRPAADLANGDRMNHPGTDSPPREPAGTRLPHGTRSLLRPDIVRLYTRQRYTIRRIANELGVAYGTVHQVLREAGVEVRPRGGLYPKQPPDRPEIVRLYTEQRYPMQRIAEKLGVSYRTVRRILHEADVEVRPPVALRLPKGTRSRLRLDIVRLYTEQRYPMRRIANELDVSYNTVHRVLHEAEVEVRPRGGPSPTESPERPAIVGLYTEQRYPMRRVAATLGVSYRTVRRTLRQAEVTIRPRGAQKPTSRAT